MTPPEPGSPQAQRRQLSVLFCDLVGSTEIARELDPEDWGEVLAEYHAAAADAVQRFGGYVAQYLGDGLLAYFGYPQAHEDDPERAVLAGLAIVQAVSALHLLPAAGRQLRLAVRVGIDTGPVVVGESDARRANVFGGTPNLAFRVQNAAAPNSVFLTAATHQLVSGRFVVEDVGIRDFKGIDQAVQLYRAIRPSGTRGRLAVAAAHGLTPFVGREHELQFLTDRWRQALGGAGQFVLVLGEPGIGKSRLVQRFHERLADTPHIWTECAASALHQNTPFYALCDALGQGFGWRGLEAQADRLAALEASLVAAGAKLDEAVPLIAPLVNLELPPRYQPSRISPEQQRRQLLATVVAWVTATARTQPQVVVVEDLHWADPSTLEVVQLLAEQGATAPLLLLCTARPEFRAPWPARTHHAQIALGRLGTAETRSIVAARAAAGALAAPAVEAIVERSGGVPLFTEELTRAALTGDQQVQSMRAIPPSLHDLLMARLDRLAGTREIAQFGSVIGDEFSWDLLNAVTGIGEQELEAHLGKLADSELVYVQGIPPAARYRFRHALIQDAAYQSLLRSERQGIHRRIADALEQQFKPETDAAPQLLAHHFTAAGMPAKAVPYWLAAGQNSVRQSANAEAINQLSRGLDLLGSLPEGPERLQQELAFQLALGTPLIATKGFAAPEVGKVYARARELCGLAGDAPQLFPVLWGLWVFYTARAEHATARGLAEQCGRLAQAAQDPDLIMEAHHALGVTMLAFGEFAAGLEQLERAITIYDPHRHGPMAFVYGQDSGVVCRSHTAWALWFLGKSEQAVRRNDEALRLAREISHPYSLTVALAFAAWLHQFLGDRKATREYAEAALALATEHNFAFWIPMGLILQGWAIAERDQTAQGVALMRQGLATFQAIGAEIMRPYYLGLLAEVEGKAGNADAGLRLVEEALAASEKSGERWWDAELHRLRGELTYRVSLGSHGVPGVLEQVKSSFDQALAIAERQGARSLQDRAATSLEWVAKRANGLPTGQRSLQSEKG